MHKVIFFSGAKPPQTGGELYNFKLSQYLEKQGWQQEYVSLHDKRHYLRLSKIPFFGDIFDAMFKANTRNTRILKKHLTDKLTTNP